MKIAGVRKIRRTGKADEGYTFLEYCAGAALIVTVVWLGLQAFGDSMNQFFQALADWTSERTQQVQNDQP